MSDLRLRQLSRQSLRNRYARIGASGDAHCLIYIRTSGKRVAYRAAKAGRRAAERFYLGRMIVRLILEHENPVLDAAVGFDLDFHGAGVYLLGFVEIFQNAGLLQVFRGEGRHIHERDPL